MDILEKIGNRLEERKSNESMSVINNRITKDINLLATLVRNSDAYPDQKRDFQKKINKVSSQYQEVFDILLDIDGF